MQYTAINSYRTQQVSTASPEKQAALLMEAGQVHLYRAIIAIKDKKYGDMAIALGRTCDVVMEADLRLDHEHETELVTNLSALYTWWTQQLMVVAKTRDIAILEMLSTQFGEVKQSWEQVK